MVPSKIYRSEYDWMLDLSAEGWAWEFLRRNLSYRSDYIALGHQERPEASAAALRWGLLQLADPDLDARNAIVFWNPAQNPSVLPLVTAGEAVNGLVDLNCQVSILESQGSHQRHVLYSCVGFFLQLAVTGDGALNRVRYLMDVLPEQGCGPKLTALRRLADLIQHKRIRPQLYGRQRRGPRLAHIAEVLDCSAHKPTGRGAAARA